MASNVPAVFAAMSAVRNEINAIGLAKDSEAQGGGIKFKFRGIDAVLNTFSGPMFDAGLMIVPAYSDLRVEIRDTKNGKTFNSTVLGTYTLVSTVDGSTFPMGSFYGEANDTQDKSIAKAQSIALRQAYLQTFVVPLGPEMDPENGDSTGVTEDGDEEERPPQARQVEGELMSGDAHDEERPTGKLTEAQKRILTQKAKNAGMTVAEVERGLGFKIGAGNFNEAMEWIRGRQRTDA